MPKSLDNGPSERIPVTVSASEKQALFAVLRDGETVSELTRQLWRKEMAKRKKETKQVELPGLSAVFEKRVEPLSDAQVQEQLASGGRHCSAFRAGHGLSSA